MLRGEHRAPSQNDRKEVRRIQLYIQGQNKRTQRFHYIICLTAILACTGGQTVHAFYANAMPCRYVVHSRTHSRSYVICIYHKVRYILCFSTFVTVNTAHKKNVSMQGGPPYIACVLICTLQGQYLCRGSLSI